MAILSKRTEATLQSKGYVTIRVAAERLGQRRPSIDRLVRDNKVNSVVVAGIRVIEWNSLLEYVGADTVRLLDLQPFEQEPAKRAMTSVPVLPKAAPSNGAVNNTMPVWMQSRS